MYVLYVMCVVGWYKLDDYTVVHADATPSSLHSYGCGVLAWRAGVARAHEPSLCARTIL